MKYIKQSQFALVILSFIIVFSSCNKDLEIIPAPVPVPQDSGVTLGRTLKASENDSLYYHLILRSGLLSTIDNNSLTFTMFVPDNNAMRQFISALTLGAIPVTAPGQAFVDFINSTNMPPTTAAAIVGYNTVPQRLTSSGIPQAFPNYQAPTLLNPLPSVSALLRLTTFPGWGNNRVWINNIPLTTIDRPASNGVIHNSLSIATPPQRNLFERISTDPELTYLHAAILRADSGIVPNPASPNTMQLILESIGANLTVFAPTDAAFRTTITGAVYQAALPLVTQQLVTLYMSMGMTQAQADSAAAVDAPAIALQQATTLASTPGVFSNPNLYPFLTAQTVQGIVAYHVLLVRAFTNNFPTSPLLYSNTLLGQFVPHPGVTLNAVYGAPFVTSATVKGLGNATPSNLILNVSPLIPDPVGTSDQHFTNGVLHKIDQVLLPQ